MVSLAAILAVILLPQPVPWPGAPPGTRPGPAQRALPATQSPSPSPSPSPSTSPSPPLAARASTSSWQSSRTRTASSTRRCSSCLRAATRPALHVERTKLRSLGPAGCCGASSEDRARGCPEPRPTSRSGRIEGGRPHRAPVRHAGVAAQAAGHRFRGGGARKGRGGRLPGGGLERGAVRADTAGGHTHRRDRVQGASHDQPPTLSVCHPVWLCIHRSCIHPYSRLVLPSIDRDQPHQPSLCPPSRRPPR